MAVRKTQVNFRLDPGLNDAIGAEASRRGISKTELVVRAVREALGEAAPDEGPTPPAPNPEEFNRRVTELSERMPRRYAQIVAAREGLGPR